MSAAEIIKALPLLTSEERAAVLQRLRELQEQDELQFLHEASDSMFQDIDKQETRNARRKSR